MPTLSQQEYDKFLKQIQAAQDQVSSLSRQINKPAPMGQVLGASTSRPLNAAQMGGASGVGYEDSNTQTQISGEVQTASEQGRPKSSAGGVVPSVMSRQEADFALRGAGLSGIIDPGQFAGMNPAEARKRIQEEKAKRTGQVSANTSFSFNPETLSGVKKAGDRFNLSLNEISNTPFEAKGAKEDQRKALVEASTRDFAKLFQSPEEFYNAYNTNPGLQQSMESFVKSGGSIDSIASKITAPVVQDGEMSTGDYLSGMSNPNVDQAAQQKAMDALMPERDAMQQQIMQSASIPKELQSLYFGTEEQMGVLEMKKLQAEEQRKLIERKEKQEIQSSRDRANLQLEKDQADYEVTKAKVEQNRLAAKNYMTGMLAKLGALTTSGAAVQAIANVDFKYQAQSQEIDSQYKYNRRLTEIELTDTVNGISNKADEMILSIQEDLTKDFETVTKEVLKAQQAADKEANAVIQKYSALLRTQTDKYTKEAKAAAEKYAKEYLKAASGGMDLFSLAKNVGGTLDKSSKKNALTASLTNVKGDIKKNLPASVANKAISELNDEQLRLFLEDYLNERVSKQRSINPETFLTEWKKATGIKDKDEDDGFEGW